MRERIISVRGRSIGSSRSGLRDHPEAAVSVVRAVEKISLLTDPGVTTDTRTGAPRIRIPRWRLSVSARLANVVALQGPGAVTFFKASVSRRSWVW